MNRELLVDAIANVDDEFIAEAREKYGKRNKTVKLKKPIRLTKKFIISAAACALAMILCISLPIALSHSVNPAVPPQSDTGTPPTDVTPPADNVENPPSGTSKPFIEEGYAGGDSDPVTGYMVAYKLNRQFDEAADNISVQLSFGLWGLKYFDNDYEFTKVSVYIENDDGQVSVFKELSPSEFLVPEYDVEIEFTYGDSDDGYNVVTSEKFIYNNEQTFDFPSSLCNRSSGFLHFKLAVYNGDEFVPNAGYSTSVYYSKTNGTINFQTYREYISDKYS